MRTFVFTDIHGNKVLFDKIYSHLKELPYEWECIFLGDACDRGKYGYEIMKTLLADERFIYLMGNHEDMFVKAARAIFRNCWDTGLTNWPPRKQEHDVIMAFSQDPDVLLSIQNGGFPTLLAWLKDGGNMSFVNKIAKLPLSCTTGRFDLCHSGTTKEAWLHSEDTKEYVWNEKHYNESWFEGRTLIFGHRPVEYLAKIIGPTKNSGYEVVTILPFRKPSSKIDLDTSVPETVLLLALDNLSVHIFKEV